MTRTLLATALLSLLVPATGRADDADAGKQVAMLSKKIIDANLKGESKTLDELLSDDFVGINPNGDIASKSQGLKDMKDGTTDFESFDPSEVKVRVFGDAAVLTGRYRVKLKYKGHDIDDLVRTTEVFARLGGKWQCVSMQVTRIAGQSGEKR